MSITIDKIINAYLTDKQQSIFISPNIEARKISNFIDYVDRNLKIKINTKDVIVHVESGRKERIEDVP